MTMIRTRNVGQQPRVGRTLDGGCIGGAIRAAIRATAGTAMLLFALAWPGTAAAAPADDLRDFLDVVRAAGMDDYATQIEQSVTSMSDEQFRVFAGPALVGATAALRSYLEAENAARAAGLLPGNQAGLDGLARHSVPGEPFPVANTTFAACPQVPNDAIDYTEDADFSTIYGLRVAFTVLKDAFIAYQTVVDAAKPACQIIVIAIGIGGNASVSCIPFSIGEAALRIALDAAFFTVDSLEACRMQRFWAKSQASYSRAEHIEDQLSTHDADMKYKLAYHDVRVQEKLREALAREARIEDKADLGLKTQLELAMGRKGIKEPSIFYMDRLDELCDVAQEAIDDLPPMYVLADLAQSSVTQGKAFKVTDPKRAVSLCTRGFNLATRDSLLPR